MERVEHALEDAVERAGSAARRTATRHLGDRFVAALTAFFKAIGLLLLIAYFAFGLLYLGTRYWLMPRIDDYRPRIEAAVSKELGVKVKVDRIETDWRGINPHLRLMNVRIFDASDNVALALPELQATLSWTSVPTLRPRFTSVLIVAPELEIRRLPGNKFAVAGFVLDPDAPSKDGSLLDWVLAQRRIAIRDMRLRYIDEAATAAGANAAAPAPLEFEEGDFEYRHGLLTHRLAIRARPPSELAGKIDVRMEFRQPPLERMSNFRRWTGRVFVQTEYADLAQLLTVLHLPESSFVLQQGQGAIRAWMQFDQMRVQGLTADVALANVDVQLARDHPQLHLAGVQGRFVQHQLDGAWQDGQELSFTNFSAVGSDGITIPETDLRLRLAPFGGIAALGEPGSIDPRRGEFTATRVRIEALLRLAEHAPIASSLRETIQERNLHGELFDTQIAWQRPGGADPRYNIQTRFVGLGSRAKDADPLTTRTGIPRPGLPGFENLSGTLTATEVGGKVQVDADDAVLEFPGIFETARLAPGKVKAAAGWATRPRLEIRFESVAISNPDVDLTGTASYHVSEKGPGFLEVTAKVARLKASSGYLYAPLVLGSGVRNWLRLAFTDGEAVDGAVHIRGELGDFPFANGSGEFLATAHVRGVNLDYLSPALFTSDAPSKARWPAASKVEGDLRVERNKLQFIAQSAAVLDSKIDRAEVRIPELVAPDPHLFVNLTANGTAADVLRFVNTSPVGGWLGNFLAETHAEGKAQTDIRLDVPLKDSHGTKVNGAITLTGGDVNLMPDLPPLYGAAGKIEFTESSFKIGNVLAGFVGGQVNLDGGMRPDGPIVVTASGTATPAGVRRLADIDLVHRALDKSQGSARYTGTLTIKQGRPELRVESNFSGWSVDLPPPLQKGSAEEWPSRFEIVPQGDQSGPVRTDRVRMFIADRLALQIARRTERGGTAQLQSGIVYVGRGDESDVQALPDNGLRVVIDVPRLDVDRWTPLFASKSGDGTDRASTGDPGAGMPNLIAARVGELVFSGKTISNLVLGATRASEGNEVLWLANVVSDNATGSVNWRMPGRDGPGLVKARLARLLVADSARSEMADVLDTPSDDAPALDVVVDSFEIGEHKLGQLELIAQNTGSGSEAEWQLQKLEISNPDARMHATGRWYREPGAQRRTMSLDMALQFSNAGRLLGRFGIPDALKAGEGTLDGQLSWRGAPTSIDWPTLAGSLKLVGAKGQFLKADAGAGRLLGVLSLQALPRRLTTLDFRDVFSDGFAFDSITATAAIAAGVVSTRDFRMRSPNATVLIEGSSDLRAETQNLHVLVLPEVNVTSASLVYALLANPAIGLGTFIAQLLLRDPLSKAFSFEYDVTGSWRDPVVKKRERVPVGQTGNDVEPQTRPQQ